MNILQILYYSLKMSIQNTITRIKELFKSKKKQPATVCFTAESTVGNYYVLNLLKEIKIVDFTEKQVESFKNLIDSFEKYPVIKTVYHSVLIKYVLKHLLEKYPNNFVYIEESDKNPLLVKVHLFNKDVFEKIFVIPEHREKLENNAIISMTYGGKEQTNYILALKILNSENMSIVPGDFIKVLSNFTSILNIINADISDPNKDINFYLLNESFDKFISSKNNNSQNNDEDILKTILGDKDIDDFIIYNKIL